MHDSSKLNEQFVKGEQQLQNQALLCVIVAFNFNWLLWENNPTS